MTFLTIEDVNTVNLQHINEFYELDTRKISLQEFNGVLYDFNIVSHTINGGQHTFTFEIYNNLWSRLYHIADNNGDVISPGDITVSFANDVLTVVTTEASIKLRLLLSSYYKQNNIGRAVAIPVEPFLNMDKKQFENIGTQTLQLYNYDTEEEFTRTVGTDDIGNHIFSIDNGLAYILVNLKKTDLQYDLHNTILQAGIINNVRLNINPDYLPGGDLIGDIPLDMQILFNGKTIKVEQVKDDEEQVIDYGFQLDLTNKTDNKPVNFTVVINEIDYVNPLQVDYSLKCGYASADNFEDLQAQLTAGAEVIELTGDITFANNIILPNPIYIIGNNHRVDLSTYNINTDKNNVKCENINFENGSACFIQEPDSKLTLTGCTFKNAIIADNYKGSVISANDDGTITELNNCTFINCHHTVYVGGELTVNNCRALYNDWNNAVDTDYSAFLTSYGGTVDITNSIFDIDYTTEQLCTGTTDIKFAQSLVGLSEDVNFNNAIAGNLKNNDILPLFSEPYNNQSHIYAKYYYPQIETCVISSPVLGKEDKAVCHTVLGTDWVYKTNVQVTRADRDNDNTIRKIEWEEI